jgi:hypothetical protein
MLANLLRGHLIEHVSEGFIASVGKIIFQLIGVNAPGRTQNDFDLLGEKGQIQGDCFFVQPPFPTRFLEAGAVMEDVVGIDAFVLLLATSFFVHFAQGDMPGNDLLGQVGGDIAIEYGIFFFFLYPNQGAIAAQAHAPGLDDFGFVLITLTGGNGLVEGRMHLTSPRGEAGRAGAAEYTALVFFLPGALFLPNLFK